jgi:hypothetical protein
MFFAFNTVRFFGDTISLWASGVKDVGMPEDSSRLFYVLNGLGSDEGERYQ